MKCSNNLLENISQMRTVHGKYRKFVLFKEDINGFPLKKYFDRNPYTSLRTNIYNSIQTILQKIKHRINVQR
jgi:NAD+--asparagine ADP-ribosyltransferase